MADMLEDLDETPGTPADDAKTAKN